MLRFFLLALTLVVGNAQADGYWRSSGASIGSPVASGVAGRVLYECGSPVVLCDSANLTFVNPATAPLVTIGGSPSASPGALVLSGTTGTSMFSAVVDTLTVAKGDTSNQVVAILTTIGVERMRLSSTLVFGWTASTSDVALDTGLSRIGAGVMGLGTGAAGSFAGRLKLTSAVVAGTTIANLNASPTAGEIATITDQTVACPAKGVAPTAGGAFVCVVYYDGAGWKGI